MSSYEERRTIVKRANADLRESYIRREGICTGWEGNKEPTTLAGVGLLMRIIFSEFRGVLEALETVSLEVINTQERLDGVVLTLNSLLAELRTVKGLEEQVRKAEERLQIVEKENRRRVATLKTLDKVLKKLAKAEESKKSKDDLSFIR